MKKLLLTIFSATSCFVLFVATIVTLFNSPVYAQTKDGVWDAQKIGRAHV